MKKALKAEHKTYNKAEQKKGYHPISFQMWLVIEQGFSRSGAQDIIDGK